MCYKQISITDEQIQIQGTDEFFFLYLRDQLHKLIAWRSNSGQGLPESGSEDNDNQECERMGFEFNSTTQNLLCQKFLGKHKTSVMNEHPPYSPDLAGIVSSTPLPSTCFLSEIWIERNLVQVCRSGESKRNNSWREFQKMKYSINFGRRKFAYVICQKVWVQLFCSHISYTNSAAGNLQINCLYVFIVKLRNNLSHSPSPKLCFEYDSLLKYTTTYSSQ